MARWYVKAAAKRFGAQLGPAVDESTIAAGFDSLVGYLEKSLQPFEGYKDFVISPSVGIYLLVYLDRFLQKKSEVKFNAEEAKSVFRVALTLAAKNHYDEYEIEDLDWFPEKKNLKLELKKLVEAQIEFLQAIDYRLFVQPNKDLKAHMLPYCTKADLEEIVSEVEESLEAAELLDLLNKAILEKSAEEAVQAPATKPEPEPKLKQDTKADETPAQKWPAKEFAQVLKTPEQPAPDEQASTSYARTAELLGIKIKQFATKTKKVLPDPLNRFLDTLLRFLPTPFKARSRPDEQDKTNQHKPK